MADNRVSLEFEAAVDPLIPQPTQANVVRHHNAAPPGKDAWGFCSPFSFFFSSAVLAVDNATSGSDRIGQMVHE
jgi:hypothetical protein